jgi:hypothetical protein
MNGGKWFDDLPVIGKMPTAAAAAKLREMGDAETADRIERPSPQTAPGPETFGIFGFEKSRERLYLNTTHSYGHFEAGMSGEAILPVCHAGYIEPDESLKKGRIKITLDRLQIASYPGGGMHRVLFDFYAKNQVQGQDEHLHFNMTYRIQEGQQAGIIGYPIFIGLNVGLEGVDLRGFTVNVKNDADERFLAVLGSDVFKSGLKLATTLQPAIAPLTGIAYALTQTVASRNRNVPVQDFYMGLDFNKLVPTRARLREGSYVVVQIPESDEAVWDWDEWVFNRNSGQLVRKDNHKRFVPYNYIVLGVSKYLETN